MSLSGSLRLGSRFIGGREIEAGRGTGGTTGGRCGMNLKLKPLTAKHVIAVLARKVLQMSCSTLNPRQINKWRYRQMGLLDDKRGPASAPIQSEMICALLVDVAIQNNLIRSRFLESYTYPSWTANLTIIEETGLWNFSYS